MPAQATYEPIATTTSTGSDFGFGSIPQTYTDLELVIRYRTNFGSNSGISAFYFNGDSGSTNRSYTWLTGNGSSLTSGRSSNDNRIQGSPIGTTPYTSSTAGHFAVIRLSLLNYTNTTTFKPMIIRYAGDLNGSGSTTLTAGVVRNTAAITQINFATYANGDFIAGTTATLYGIKAA